MTVPKEQKMNVYRAVFSFSIAVFLDIFCFSAISFCAVVLMMFRRHTDKDMVSRQVGTLMYRGCHPNLSTPISSTHIFFLKTSV